MLWRWKLKVSLKRGGFKWKTPPPRRDRAWWGEKCGWSWNNKNIIYFPEEAPNCCTLYIVATVSKSPSVGKWSNTVMVFAKIIDMVCVFMSVLHVDRSCLNNRRSGQWSTGQVKNGNKTYKENTPKSIQHIQYIIYIRAEKYSQRNRDRKAY